MKRNIIYILLSLFAFVSCTSEQVEPTHASATLHLEGLSRAGAASPMAIDEDLAVLVYDSDGKKYADYPAGTIPRKIILQPGTFTLHVYTQNQETWTTANNGLGEACYYGTAQVEMEHDAVTYLNMQVPMVNYAVTLILPPLFNDLFKSHSLNLTSNSRTVKIQEGQKAYFDAANGGFTYKLEATNTDNNTHSSSSINYKTVENGKLYNLTYYYGTDANSGGLDIEITDNMETEDEVAPL